MLKMEDKGGKKTKIDGNETKYRWGKEKTHEISVVEGRDSGGKKTEVGGNVI